MTVHRLDYSQILYWAIFHKYKLWITVYPRHPALNYIQVACTQFIQAQCCCIGTKLSESRALTTQVKHVPSQVTWYKFSKSPCKQPAKVWTPRTCGPSSCDKTVQQHRTTKRKYEDAEPGLCPSQLRANNSGSLRTPHSSKTGTQVADKKNWK